MLTLRSVRIPLLGAALFAGLPALVSTAPAWGQSQSINGTIRGHVTDATGASVAGATVTVTNAEMGYSRTLATEADGYYVLVNLPLGTYKVLVSKEGFSTATYDQIVLTAGKEAVLDPSLKVGSATEQIDVSSTVTNIDPTSLNVQRTLDSREVENLPLTSRNPYNFILFQPGVSGHPNPELGIPRTINTNGLLDRINYQMDGMVNTQSDRIGLRLFPIGDIFVKEVQTVSNSFSPEFGWTSGDVYNVISNNGTNSFHGLFQWIRRWQDATAYPFFSNKSQPKPNLELEDYSANAGGRIIKDKLFFFGSYEHVVRGQPAPVTITPANIAALGLPPDQVAPAPGLLHGTFVLGRGDWNINSKNSLFIRYNYFKNNFPYNTQVGGLNARSTASDFLDRAHVIGGQLTSTINDHLLNELRFSWPFRNNSHFRGPNAGADPAIIISQVANIGAGSNAGDQYTDKVPSGSDNVSYLRGKHTIKGGFNLAQLINRQRLVSFNEYTFSSLQKYLDAKNGVNRYGYSQFRTQQDVNGIGYASMYFGAYLQDTWQVTPRFLVVYGGRYDRFTGPEANPNAPFVNSRSFNTPNTNFAPRVGFTYRLDDHTVLKASGGIFYQATPTNLWFNALNLDGSNRTNSFTITQPANATTGVLAFPNIPASGTTAAQNVTTVSPKFKNEYTWNATMQISHEFSRNDTFMIGYIMTNGRNLQYLHNINPINPIGRLADGRPVFSSASNASTRLDTRFNQINQVESGANTSFNALIVNYTRSLSRGIQINANYTWSHTISDGPEVNTFEQSVGIEDTTYLKRDRGPSLVNHPNAFNLTAVMEPTFSLSHGFLNTLANHNMVALLANVSSGDQQNIITNVSLNGDSSVASVTRPLYAGRNSLRSPSVYQIDGRYTRTFPKLFERIAPSFLLEANNIFNHTNVTYLGGTNNSVPQTVVQTPNDSRGPIGTAIGSPTITRGSVLEARIVQIGVAARW
ncbi:TonB-dependent receptor [Edaphobacter aggregans]|uniref:TonB-dependent receptor n=1 Tax=Edaphobacter aggregans TaxID=570835 RepID=UPI0009FFA26D|nr:TonB-dependent receptor [Edaphobacter aggregans]